MIKVKIFDNRVFLLEEDKALLSVKKDNVIIFDESIKVIGESFMQNDLTIEGLILSDNIEEVETNAFLGCKNLKFVVLGKNLNTIGQCGFTGNDALRYVIYNGTKEDFDKISRGEPFEKLGIINCVNGIVHTVNFRG